MDAIIVDDLPEYSNEIIDLDEDDDIVEVTNIHNYHKAGRYDDIMKENKLMGEFIDRCLQLEHSNGMLRVINRSLIPAFERTPRSFRCSDTYIKIMTRALGNIEKFPHLKFSYVKELCLNLKHGGRFINGPYRNSFHAARFKYRKTKYIDSNRDTPKNQKTNDKITEIILSDDSDGFEPIINIEEYTKDVSVVNDKDDKCIEIDMEDIRVNDDDDVIYRRPKNNNVNSAIKNHEVIGIIEVDNEKENNAGNIKITADIQKMRANVGSDERNCVIDTPEVTISDEEIVEVTDNIEASSELETNETEHNVQNHSEPVVTDVDKLLVPHKVEAFAGYDEEMLMDRIKKIENDIAMYKDLVAKLDEEEVLDDTMYSPYIRCEDYKAKIVALYRQLCQLTGEKPIKRREVRLTAASERLELPMKKLEEFINSNIGSDGLPHFPDFADVVQCVDEANRSGGLGWNRHQVMTEARSLFTFCGKALQSSRQRREWRDLLNLVKRDMIEDPADKDPELMARLQANKRQAVIREEEIFTRYSGISNPEHAIEESNPSDDDRASPLPDIRQTHTDNTIKRVRIAPTSVPTIPISPSSSSNYVTHKVNRIVNKQNQVVEIVVSGKQVIEDSNEAATENQTSSSPPAIVEVPSNNTDGVYESSSTISACSISLMHILATGGNIVCADPQDVSPKNTAPCNSTESNASSTGKQQEIVENNYKEAPSENFIHLNDAIGLDRVESNDNDRGNFTDQEQAPQVIEPLVSPQTESNECTDVTNNTNQSSIEPGDNNQASNKILAHLLSAKVVLPKMLIKYETSDSIVDENSATVTLRTTNHNGHENEEPETTQSSELGFKIKEEPCVDIQKELDELGDDFTTTIFDIQDPFLVVEISSDSSSDDEADARNIVNYL